jgi:outer membrane biosynthesis protein TonB
LSAAGDIWSLGITLIEALTQHPPSMPGVESEDILLPADLPPIFAGMIRRCLNRNPADRPTAAALDAEINPAPISPAPQLPVATAPESPVEVPSPLVSTAAPKVREVPVVAVPPEEPPKQQWFVPAIAVLLIVGAAVGAGVHMLSSRTDSQRVVSSTAASQISQAPSPTPSEVSATSDSAKQAALPSANGSPSVLHQEIPEIPRGVRDTIRGRIKIDVRVSVDSSGNVVEEALEKAGPSKYFSRLAAEAARKWKFAPANSRDYRKWLLRFEFTRSGVSAQASGPRS